MTYYIDDMGVRREATPEEAANIDADRAAAASAAHNNEIDRQIRELEAKVTPRRLRDALISGDKTFISDIEAQIAALRAQRQ